MKKIQLTEAEIKTIEAYKNDEINTYSPENPEDQKNLDSVINKAEELLDEYPDDERSWLSYCEKDAAKTSLK